MRKTRIAFVLPSLEPGGAEKSITFLANSLSRDFQVNLLAVRNKGALVDKIIPGVKLSSLRGRFLFPFLLVIFCWKNKPDVIISTLWDLNIAIAILRPMLPKRTRLILREAINPEYDINSSRFQWLFRKLYIKYYPKADRIITLSSSMKIKLASFLKTKQDKFEIVYNAVYDNGSLNIQKEPDRKQEDVIFTSMGRLSTQKGYDLLIEAFQLVHTKHPGTRLYIYGDGKERKKLQQLIHQYHLENSVEIRGFNPDINQILDQTDVYILSSRYEGLSNAMLEALYCGIPVLAVSSNTSADEIIREGFNGFLISDCNAKDISIGLERAIHEHRNLDRTSIARDARDRFSPARQTAQYTKLIENIIAT